MPRPKHPLSCVRAAHDLGAPLAHPSGRSLTARLLSFDNGSVALELRSVMPDGAEYAVRIPPAGAAWLQSVARLFDDRLADDGGETHRPNPPRRPRAA